MKFNVELLPKATNNAWVRKIIDGKSFWPFADQLIVSFGNFVTGVVLARTLTPSDFGIYSLIYSAMLFLFTLHSSFVIYPLSVRGAVESIQELRKSIGSSLLLTMGSLPLCTIVLFTVTIILKRNNVSLLVVLALLSWLLQETLRRGLMSHLKFKDALYGDLISYLLQALILVFLSQIGNLNLSTAFLSMAITSTIAVAIQLLQVKPMLENIYAIKAFLRYSWNLGKWSVTGSLLAPFSSQIFPWALVIFYNSLEVARFNAVSNISRVINPILFSVGNMVIPYASKLSKEHGYRHAINSALQPILQGALIVGCLSAVLLVIPEKVLGVFYGETSLYVELTYPLRIFTIGYLFNFLAHVSSSILNGFQKPKDALRITITSTFFSLIIGVPVMAFYGVVGATFVFLFIHILRFSLACNYLIKMVRLEGLSVPNPSQV